MEINTDEQNIAEGIFIDPSIRTVPFEWNGKVYQFQVKSVPWVEKQRLMAKYMKAGGNRNKISIDADIGSYHQEMLLKTIVSTGGMFEMNKINLMRIPSRLGEKMVEMFVDDADELTEDDEKNC